MLGDSWNYMPTIFVPSSAKRIATQILSNYIIKCKISCFERLCLWYDLSQQTINCSKLAIEAQE